MSTGSQQLPNIALTGHLRSGKDTAAAYLVKKYGYTRFAFGDGIRDVCRQLYPDQFEDGRKPRALLQGVGQALRAFDEDMWVRKCFATIKSTVNWTGAPLRAVISDLRQPNEYDRCRAEGFVIIRIRAWAELRIQRAQAASDTFEYADLAHETEQYVDTFDVDYDVYNDGTLTEMYRQIDDIMMEENEKDT